MMPAAEITPAVTLRSLLQPWGRVTARSDRPVQGVAVDSRQVTPGALFMALPGGRVHGLAFVAEALAAGAVAVAWDAADDALQARARRLCQRYRAALIHVADLQRRAGWIAARFHGNPSLELPVVGVTGTDGKTSVTQYIGQCLHRRGSPCGIIGTLGYGPVGALLPGEHTTPDAVRIQRLLRDMADIGAGAVAMEVSSHALDQGRAEGVRFAVAVLTNLTRDHLDYHGSEAAYAEAKARLFRTPELGAAVLNLDDAFGRSLAEELAARVPIFGYSRSGASGARVTARSVEPLPHGLRLELVIDGDDRAVEVPILGRFNADNCLATVAALLALGIPAEAAVERLAQLRPVPGRMERFGGGDLPHAVVDYAHTPAALAGSLRALREHFPGEIWCVFGCGGDRDRGKRPLMAEAAARYADRVIVTDDNPRTENGDAIVDEILAGLPAEQPADVIRNRGSAIAHAVRSARPGDVVLVAGKGHEDYQIVGQERRAFSDRLTVKACLGGVR